MAAPSLDAAIPATTTLTVLESSVTRSAARSLVAIDAETVARLLTTAGVRWVRLEFADLHGIARSKLVPLARFEGIVTGGAHFYGGGLHLDARAHDLPANAFPSGPPLLPDYTLMPDLTTLAVLDSSQVPGTSRVVCDLCTLNGIPSPLSPRTAVRTIVDEYAALGLSPRLGFEYEFVLLRRADGEPVFPDRQYAATLHAAFDPELVEALAVTLDRIGVEVEDVLVESAPGQLEIPLRPADGMAAPDRAFAFKTTVKEVALRHGYTAHFMTKPAIAEAANGLHVHQSLIDDRTGVNVFTDTGGLSALGTHFLAGQMVHARALCAFLAPTVNCYKSFQPGMYAPHTVAWSVDDREVALRVPRAVEGATRIENRIGRAAANPYLVTAALLAAGLDGVQRGLALHSPCTATPDSGRRSLPRSLGEALDALVADAPLRALLPEPLVELYLTVKRAEVARLREVVPDADDPSFNERIDPWEVMEYGEMI